MSGSLSVRLSIVMLSNALRVIIQSFISPSSPSRGFETGRDFANTLDRLTIALASGCVVNGASRAE